MDTITYKELESAVVQATWGTKAIIYIRLNPKVFKDIKDLLCPEYDVWLASQHALLTNAKWLMFQTAFIEAGEDVEENVIRMWNNRGQMYQCYREMPNV